MKKTRFLYLVIILITLGFISCDTGNGLENGTGDGNNEFTVTFDLDGGNISGNTASVEIKVNSGGTIPILPNPQKGTDTFSGWFTQKNGLGIEFTSSTIITGDIIVFAKWSQINNEPKKITITGLNGKNGYVVKILLFNLETDSFASGKSTINNDSVIISLLEGDGAAMNDDLSGADWTKTGLHGILLLIVDFGLGELFFTDGEEPSKFGLDDQSSLIEILTKVPKYNIIDTITTIDFSKFKGRSTE